MTLEKRIEELESEVSSLKEVVTSLVGGDFSIKEGEVFIANAFIQPNIDSNVSAIIENSEATVSQRTIMVWVNCSQELNDGVNTDKRIAEFEQQVSEMKKQLTAIQQAVAHYQDSSQSNFNDIDAAIHSLQQEKINEMERVKAAMSQAAKRAIEELASNKT
ncbi:hypothetical protein [Yersinia enterocolitica]|uniref:hypothetical protein n=1 Tax=Yersinia enterocolitica TaxID=630 RepID=UPI003F45E7E0